MNNEIIDVWQDLQNDLGIEVDNIVAKAMINGNNRYVKDLRVNLKNVMVSEHLTAKEIQLVALSVAGNAKNSLLIKAFSAKATNERATMEEISEALACASLLSSNNITYRFRHFVGKDSYNSSPMKIKMNIMLRPVLGKELFELLSLVVSSINGCEMCVKSHEHSLIEMGVSESKIWDCIRIAGVIISLDRIVF